jgi:hypothetical protein
MLLWRNPFFYRLIAGQNAFRGGMQSAADQARLGHEVRS